MSKVASEISVIPGLLLTRPIPVIFEESDEDVVIRWPEAQLAGIGAHEAFAIESFRELVLETWSDFISSEFRHSSNTLMMRDVMRQYVGGMKLSSVYD